MKSNHASPVGLSKGLFKGEPKLENNKMITAHQRKEKLIHLNSYLKESPKLTSGDKGRILL